MPDGYVPVRLVADAFRRPVQTIHTWAREGVVRSCRDVRGRLLVHWRDVFDAARTRQRRGGVANFVGS